MNQYLLDTSYFLKFINDDSPEIPSKVLSILQNTKNDIYISHACLWEITIKYQLNKLKLEKHPRHLTETILAYQFKTLPITLDHIFQITELPNFHHDPFDRLLISQAIIEKMILLTEDSLIKKYPVKML